MWRLVYIVESSGRSDIPSEQDRGEVKTNLDGKMNL